jgi:CBS domain-containing protein
MTEDLSQPAFFNQPVSAIFRPNIATCPLDTPVQKAAQKMSRYNTSAILITDPARRPQGIVTDADLRNKVLAHNLASDTPVSKVMSAPVITISSDCQVFEAFLTMMEKDKRHLAVCGDSGDISGIITEKDLITAQTKAAFLLLKSVTSARAMPDLENIHARLCRMLVDPISKGVNPEHITRLITTFSDAILEKIMGFCLAETGPAPCPFVFLTMGSEGRGEQTLVSDQDNAIVYADPASGSEADAAQTYFNRLAGLVCTRLDMAGYRFCDGNNMAQNPRWCQPLSVWKQYFHTWIRKAKPEDLLYSSIFFDFKGTYGDLSLSRQLKTYLLESIQGWSGFLRNMTENALYFRPPIGLFGKLKVSSEGKHKNVFDIKYAMMPITDVTRVFALKENILQTNTLGRLFRLYTRQAVTAREYHNIVQSYNFLMKLRFTRQITNIMDEGTPPDNYINPENLSHLDRHMLKEIFKIIENFQQKLNMEFTGVV